jgi:hypothetical protein
MAKKGKVIWVRKGAFVMPVLPKNLKIDPLLAGLLHTMAFLELSDDDTVDPDWAVEAMEHVAYYFQRMDDRQVETIQEQLDRITAYAKKKKMPEGFTDLAENLLRYAGVGDDDMRA